MSSEVATTNRDECGEVHTVISDRRFGKEPDMTKIGLVIFEGWRVAADVVKALSLA